MGANKALDKLFGDDNDYSLTTILRALVFARSNRLQAFSRTSVRA
jgi:hypothetical protein